MFTKAITASVWLGWQRELSWGNPAFVLLLKTAGPVAAVMTATIVFWFGSSQASLAPATLAHGLAYIVVGASLYGQISIYAWVPTSAIAEGKNTNLFPQVYITPPSAIPYLAGRCLASFVISLPVVCLAFAIPYYADRGLFGYSLPIEVSPLSVALVAIAMLASFPAALGLGFTLGSYSIFASRLEWAIPAYIAGSLMIFSEALFPLSVLPWPLSAFGQAVPFTYLMRAARAALLDPGQRRVVAIAKTLARGQAPQPTDDDADEDRKHVAGEPGVEGELVA